MLVVVAVVQVVHLTVILVHQDIPNVVCAAVVVADHVGEKVVNVVVDVFHVAVDAPADVAVQYQILREDVDVAKIVVKIVVDAVVRWPVVVYCTTVVSPHIPQNPANIIHVRAFNGSVHHNLYWHIVDHGLF